MIYTHVLPYISGVDANRAMIALALGKRPSVQPPRSRAANIEFLSMPRGILAAIEGRAEAAVQPGVLGMHFNVAVGDCIGPLNHKDDRPGYIVTGGDTTEHAMAATQRAKSCLRVRMQGGDRALPVS